MAIEPDTEKRIETYLGALRARLRGVDKEEVQEIIQELRSHLIDKSAAAGGWTGSEVDSALAGLGSPEALAAQYVTDYLLARAEITRSPFRVLDSLFRWASLSVAGFFVLLTSLAGYLLGGVFVLSALLKPLHARDAGLWLIPDGAGDYEISLRLGLGGAPGAGRELLGWWIVPLGLIAGCGLVMLTTRFALWCARQYRRSREEERDQ